MNTDLAIWDSAETTTFQYIESLMEYQLMLDNLFIKSGASSMYNSFFFQNISLPTFFAQIFTTFEYNLIGICDKIHGCNKEKFTYKDLRGSDLEKANVYIKRTLDIDISKYQDWQLLLKFQAIRHKIIHSHCTFKKGEDFQKTLESYNGVITNGSDYEHRIFSFQTTDIHVAFIKLIHRYFSKLFEEIYLFYTVNNK